MQEYTRSVTFEWCNVEQLLNKAFAQCHKVFCRWECSFTSQLPVTWLFHFLSYDCSLPVMWLSIKPPKLAFCWAFHLLTRRTRTHLCLHTRVPMHACLAVEFWSSSECILCTMQCMIGYFCVSCDLRSCASTAAVRILGGSEWDLNGRW